MGYVCYTCKKQVNPEDIRYHTSPEQGEIKIFCDAYCSYEYYKPIIEGEKNASKD